MKKVFYEPSAFRDYIESRYPDETRLLLDAFNDLKWEDAVWCCAIPDTCTILHFEEIPDERLIIICGYDVDEYMPEVG